jgi:hypothetical protein
MLRLFRRSARSMNLLVAEVWHAQKNVQSKHRCGTATVLLWKIPHNRPGDYKLRCTLTTGVRVTRQSNIWNKKYSIQRSFLPSTWLFTTISKLFYNTFFIERYSLRFNPETSLFQVGLGIATLLFYVPVPLASLHQCGALVTLSSALWCQSYKTLFFLRHRQ